MERKKYFKPVFGVQKFVPNEFVAACTITIRFTSGSFMEYTQKNNALYHDANHDDHYNNGERVGAESSAAVLNKTVEIYLQDNKEAGYIDTNASTGQLYCKNQNDNYYFTSYTSSGYGATTKYVYKIIDLNNVVHYFNTGGFEVKEKHHS